MTNSTRRRCGVFYASAMQRSAVGGVTFSGCSYVLVSVRAYRTLFTRYLEKCWTYFLQTFSIGAFWDKDEGFEFSGQKIKVQGCGRFSMLENGLMALLMRYLENFWISPNFRRSVFGVNRSKVKVTSWACVDFLFVVVILVRSLTRTWAWNIIAVHRLLRPHSNQQDIVTY